MLLDLLFSLTSASFHDPREQKSVIGWRADCFDGSTACGAANLRPLAISQGRVGWVQQAQILKDMTIEHVSDFLSNKYDSNSEKLIDAPTFDFIPICGCIRFVRVESL